MGVNVPSKEGICQAFREVLTTTSIRRRKNRRSHGFDRNEEGTDAVRGEEAKEKPDVPG